MPGDTGFMEVVGCSAKVANVTVAAILCLMMFQDVSMQFSVRLCAYEAACLAIFLCGEYAKVLVCHGMSFRG